MNKKFKPLWMIHNRTYRKYAKGLFWKSFRRYLGKLKKVLKLLIGRK